MVCCAAVRSARRARCPSLRRTHSRGACGPASPSYSLFAPDHSPSCHSFARGLGLAEAGWVPAVVRSTHRVSALQHKPSEMPSIAVQRAAGGGPSVFETRLAGGVRLGPSNPQLRPQSWRQTRRFCELDKTRVPKLPTMGPQPAVVWATPPLSGRGCSCLSILSCGPCALVACQCNF